MMKKQLSEIFVVGNLKIFQDFQYFSKNALISLVWDGFGTQIDWKTAPKPSKTKDMRAFFEKILKILENFEVNNKTFF